MRVDCVSCGYAVNLDHKVFDDYSGPIRCYCCGAMMEMKTEQGRMRYLIPAETSGMRVAEERHENQTVSGFSLDLM